MNLSTTLDLRANHKLHYRTAFQGLPISVENRKGSIRRGCNKSWGCWATKMHIPYGYIRGTRGVDGDAVDVFIGHDVESKFAYVVHTRKSPDFKTYDEDKVMLGFSDARSAKKAMLRHFNDSRFFGGMDAIPMEEFKKKVLQTKSKPQKLVGKKLESSEAVRKRVKAGIGEPGVYEGGMGHLETTPTFHPPSLKKAKRVPADNPGEKDDRFMDVTKRNSKATKKFRDERTRRVAVPTQLPGGPTLVNQHSGIWMPFVTQQ